MSIRKIAFEIVFLVFLSTFVPVPIIAQNGMEMSVRGNVRDVNSNEPIPKVRIFLFKIEDGELTRVYSDISNNRGNFKVRFLPAGKYRFGIDIPEIGYLHIFWLSDNEGAALDYYDFEIKEEQNKRIDILLGKAQYPSVSRIDNNLLGKISFTIKYTSNSLKNIDSRGKAAQTTCDNLTITGPEIDIVGDEVQLLSMKGESANGQIIFESSFKYSYDCFKDKCYYENLRLNVNVVITLHTPNYYSQFYPGINDNDFFVCLKECTLKHEMYHFNAYPSVACKWWEEILNKANSMKDECCDNKESCKKNMNKIWEEYSLKIDKDIGNTEIEAEALSEGCGSDCLKSSNKGGQND